MSSITAVIQSKSAVRKAVFDMLVITVIYFVPAFAHMFSYPVYLLDPMRIMVVLAIIYTSRNNAVLLALTLPIFSFIVSAHPIFYKALIMSGELTINVLLFFMLKKSLKNLFASLLISIAAAKIFYYTIKTILVTAGLIGMDVISTPLYMQLIVAVVLCGYIQFFSGNRLKE